jgi:hypothetical protein
MPLYNPATTTVTDATISTSDITTNNASTSKHGFLKKLDNTATNFMDGTGAWSVPGGTGSVASDALWDAKGDLAGGTGANTAAKLTVGSNGTVLTADSGETTGLKWATPSGGSLTQAYIGYNTIGASYDTPVINAKYYLKKVTISTACLITSIGGYFDAATTGQAEGPSVGLYTDSAGTPAKAIGYSGNPQVVQISGARWIEVPLGIWVTAADYWIAVRFGDSGGAVFAKLAYDTSGSDIWTTSTGVTNAWPDYGSLVSPANSTFKFSIRANTIT